MNRLLIVLLIFVVFFGWKKYHNRFFGKNALPVIVEQSLDPCREKSFCGVVYVAPWCPACEQISSYLKQLADKVGDDGDKGFLIIVGDGKANENKAKVDFYASHVLADNDATLRKSLGVTYYPTFLVIDSKRKIILRDQEAADWIQKNL